MNELIQHFEKMSTDSSSGPKLISYSGHDANIATLLHTLQASQPHFPEFACSLFFELRKKNEEYFVNMFYKKKETEPVKIAGKCEDISFGEFRKFVRNYAVDRERFLNECLSDGSCEEFEDDMHHI